MIFDKSTLEPLKINIGTKEELKILGFTPDRNSLILTVVLCIVTGGLLLLLLSWKPSIRLKFTHIPCNVKDAKVLLVTDIYGVLWEEKVEDEEITVKEENAFRRQKFFCNKKIKYIWDDAAVSFIRVSFPPPGTRLSSFPPWQEGLNFLEARERKQLFGENKIAIETPTIWNLFVSQAREPLFTLPVVFLLIMLVKLVLKPPYYEYYEFVIVIVGVSFLYFGSLFAVVYQIIKQTKVLREKISTKSRVQVIRNNNVCVVESSELVPGDVCIVVASNELLEADMVLLQGSVIMNEAILTGESVPITKVHVGANDDEPFDKEKQKRHVLHGGTQVLQVRGGAQLKALVVSTGYDSVKGEMIRSILFPKPMGFHIYSDFLKLIFIFVLLGIAATIWSLVWWSKNKDSPWNIVLFNSLDLMTFVIPPIIPATITSINLWAQRRLKKDQIFCLSSNYISLAGPTDVICFDKTGTLTEEDLCLEGVVPTVDGEFLSPVADLRSLPEDSSLTRTLASCHSVAKSQEGKYIGHPLDIKIFSAIDWEIQESEESNIYELDPLFVVTKGSPTGNLEIAVLKTYPFDSIDQRMTVIGLGKSRDQYEVFIKGAPEKVASLCSKESVPPSFDAILEWYTKQGLRVIAAACSILPPALTWKQIEDTQREDLEDGATFLGLIILQNRLKEESTPAIRTLQDASITTVMITGDNLLTATCVARQCEIIGRNQQLVFVKADYVESSTKAVKHLKIHFYDSQQDTEIFTKSKLQSVLHSDFVFGTDGESFRLIHQYDGDTFRKIIHRGRIFARMKPDQKIQVIEALQVLGHQVAMCGDGCNDCGALKAAHSGISLSSSEASVAAPFTSLRQDISCVSSLIREGRTTLISTYASFKYNISYCLSLLIVVLMIFTVYTEPSDTQYLIMDLVLITVPSLMMGNTGASPVLTSKRPSKRMIHPIHVLSILSFLAFQLAMYWVSFDYLENQSWYVRYNSSDGSVTHKPSYEGTVLILEAFFSLQIAALIFSHGHPYRKPIYKNKILSGYLVISTALCVFFLFCKASWLEYFFSFKHIAYPGFTWTIFLIIILVGILCYIWERWFLYGVLENKIFPWFLSLLGPRYPYEKLEETIRTNPQWPKLESYSPHEDFSDQDEKQSIIEEVNDEPLDKSSRFFRKPTQRQKFSPSDVKYVDEVQELNTNRIIYQTSSKEYEDPKSLFAELRNSTASVVQSDSEYSEPVDSLPEDKNFNGSFRSQLFKGKPMGAMQTFGRKQQKPEEVEAYEIVSLSYNLEKRESSNSDNESPDSNNDTDSVRATVSVGDIQSPMSETNYFPFNENKSVESVNQTDSNNISSAEKTPSEQEWNKDENQD